MLKRFYVDNFKTHINTTFDVSPINLLIGANNSGKTNLCQSMRFLGLTSLVPLSKAASLTANEDWTLANVSLGKSTIDFRVEADLTYQNEQSSFNYDLSIVLLGPTEAREAGSRIAVRNETLTVSAPGFENTRLIMNEGGRVQLLHETLKSRGAEERYALTTAPVDTTMLNRLYDLKDNPRANLFKKYLSSWLYYDLDSQQLRRPEAKLLDNILVSDGSNLASVLFNLKNANERVYRRLIDLTGRIIEPNLDLLSFFSPAESQVFMFAEDSAGHRFGPWSMSNGTLRFIALAYIFLTPQAFSAVGGSRMVIVEEPENGLYVGHLKELFSLIDPAGTNGQYIFTSHSPYFIDLFDGLLEGVTIAKRGEKSTELRRPDPKDLRRRLETMPLGEMHFREMLV